MPKGYPHLTYDKRCQIFTLKKRNLTQAAIAKEMGISQSTVSKELRRNCGTSGYDHQEADLKAQARRRAASSRKHKMSIDLIKIIEEMIRNKLSPEQISGRLKLEKRADISAESIYRHVWRNKKNGGDLYKYLRRTGKKYNKRSGKNAGRGLIPNRVGIENRPAEVDAKERVGDFEFDTVIGRDHLGAILTIVERKTKLTLMHLMSGPKANETCKASIALLSPIKTYIHTGTSDNGKEFAGHEIIAKELGMRFFFANAYHSWERGLNENTNGLIRQYFPKKTDFKKLAQKEILDVQIQLNNRPRKTLGYRTPYEEFARLTGHFLKQ